MKLDSVALEGYRERFLERMPDFSDFTVRSGRYWTEEREYKDEISRLCQDLLPATIFQSRSERSDEQVFQAVRKIFTVKLKSIKKPQNIVGWREAASLRSYGAHEKSVLAEALGALLYGSAQPAEKIDEFNRRMWPVFKGGERANPFSRSRLIPTFFLMMIDPDRDIAVRTDLFDDVSQDFLGRSILGNQVFTGSEYLEILGIASAVRSHLERWGWCPNDMIDVHSFLWTACWEYEDEADESGENE